MKSKSIIPAPIVSVFYLTAGVLTIVIPFWFVTLTFQLITNLAAKAAGG
jgi:hypothetical protein